MMKHKVSIQARGRANLDPKEAGSTHKGEQNVGTSRRDSAGACTGSHGGACKKVDAKKK